MSDPFDRWGLPEDASDHAIRQKYRRLVQQMHPDRIGHTPQSQQDFCQLQDDYALLKDRSKRQALIARRRASRQPDPPLPPPRSAPAPRRSPPKIIVPHSDIHVTIPVPLSIAWAGGACGIYTMVAHPCSCARHPSCPQCRGTGQVFVRKKLILSIPPGTLNQRILRAAGQGHVGTQGVGDLYATVQWVNTHGWGWDKDILSNTIVVPPPQYQSGHRVWLVAPSGTLGVFRCPTMLDTEQTKVMLPELGFFAPDGRRESVMVVLRRSSWWTAWTAACAQLALWWSSLWIKRRS